MKVELVSEASVLAALGKVQEPELRNDLVSLNMIHDLDIHGDQVKFTIMLDHPCLPAEDQDRKRSPGGRPGACQA